jgi:hypothetical protein
VEIEKSAGFSSPQLAAGKFIADSSKEAVINDTVPTNIDPFAQTH